MENFVVKPMTDDYDVVIQFTDEFVLDDDTTFIVPLVYDAFVLIDKRVAFKIRGGIQFTGCKEEYKGRPCRVAFVSSCQLPNLMWGLMGVQINNARLNETYRLGARGEYYIEIDDIAKLVHEFETQPIVTTNVLRAKLARIFQTASEQALINILSESEMSVLQLYSHKKDLEKSLSAALANAPAFSEFGISISSIRINSFDISDEDLQQILNRQNS